MSASPTSRRRSYAGIAVAAFLATALTACFPGGGDSKSGGGVSYDGEDSAAVQSATIQFSGQGTFVEPDTIDPAEYRWSGSGFFITSDGIAVTNNHVVTGAGSLSVTIGGEGDSYPVRVLSTSECLDIAVVQVDVDKPVPYFDWAEGKISTGSDVYALGYPLGDPTFSMTKGAVVKSDYAFDTFDNVVAHGIQSDAAIRGGNSGGPLINEKGKVVGVNFYGNDNLATSNYAIGRDDVLPVLDDLKAGKSVLSLGLNLSALTTDDPYGLSGIWVQSVAEGSAADKAGIEPGDVLQKLGGVTLAGASSLSQFENTTEGTMKNYCQVLQTKGVDAPMGAVVYRPATDELLEGEINGSDPIEVTASGVLGGGGDGGNVSSGYTDIVSDDYRIAVTVPAEWNQVATTPGAGETLLQASSDLGSFGSLAAPGVELHSTDYQALGAPADVIATLDLGLTNLGCTPSSGQIDQDYADGQYSGLFSVYTSCPTGADAVVVVVDADNGDASGYLLILGTFGDYASSDPGVLKVLNTFTLS
ncbi:S1C family serine protease [Protaetiibacter larvae]|uniref:Serine protease n=1 Tax=Protaetiibacter larvae TaxID=2592654 RepID=A0A5C1Y5L1_9MICO|nr:S1C family serine protease [Protaetiibacter larvae]QEO09333.1 serine protease [Protaetiibacter larvae]